MSDPSHPIYHLRNANLSPELALRLAPFLNAHRPHSDIPTREELGDRIPNESPVGLKNIAEDIGRKYIPKKKV
jgi:hypothetical protein